MNWTGILAIAIAALTTLPLGGQQPTQFGTPVTPTVHRANPAKLYPDLATLVAASDEIFVIHVNRTVSWLSPSGKEPVTQIDATVVQDDIKGIRTQIQFTVPTGTAQLGNLSLVSATYEGFTPLSKGKRYLVFLRFPRGEEELSLTRTRRLAGDAIQGAFELNDELVEPAFRADGLSRVYWHMPVKQFLDQVLSLVRSQRAR